MRRIGSHPPPHHGYLPPPIAGGGGTMRRCAFLFSACFSFVALVTLLGASAHRRGSDSLPKKTWRGIGAYRRCVSIEFKSPFCDSMHPGLSWSWTDPRLVSSVSILSRRGRDGAIFRVKRQGICTPLPLSSSSFLLRSPLAAHRSSLVLLPTSLESNV